MTTTSDTAFALASEKLLRNNSESYRDVVVVHGLSRSVRVSLGISAAINISLFCALAWFLFGPATDTSLGKQWSPANEAISHKEIVFDSSVQNGQTTYQGAPNPENNALWHNLYNNVGIYQIPASLAARLQVPSSPAPGHENKQFVQLDVFHDLHCLNMIRLMLWAGSGSTEGLYLNATHLGDTREERVGHVDDCVDQVRQYLMCHAGTAPLVWQWSERNKKYPTYMGMKHTCRDLG